MGSIRRQLARPQPTTQPATVSPAIRISSLNKASRDTACLYSALNRRIYQDSSILPVIIQAASYHNNHSTPQPLITSLTFALAVWMTSFTSFAAEGLSRQCGGPAAIISTQSCQNRYDEEALTTPHHRRIQPLSIPLPTARPLALVLVHLRRRNWEQTAHDVDRGAQLPDIRLRAIPSMVLAHDVGAAFGRDPAGYLGSLDAGMLL
jgi:hypothetical protein